MSKKEYYHEGYEKERQEVEKYYNKIKINPNLIYDTSKSIINYLLPIKRFAVAPAGFNDIKAVRRSDENLPEFTEAVYDLITDLKETSDKNIQKELINSFKTGQYGKGIQTAILSSVLFYLNPNYLLINTKTVNTFNLLSEVIGDNEKINGNLTDYIDNLEKLSKLLGHLSRYVPDFSDFEVFDAFCHWMCDKNLGYYAIDADKFERWLEGLDEVIKVKKYPDVCLYPETIKTNILTKKKIFNQLCGTLNSGKHEWIQPEIIEKMSYEDLKEHYLEYFNSGTGEKQNLIAIKRDQIIRNEKFRESLLYLLNEDVDIKTRIDELMDIKNDKHIDGMSRALITAFLMDFKPDKYCLWNGKTESGFKALDWENLYKKRGDSTGDVYIKVLGLLERLKTLGSDLGLNFLDVDLFLHV